MEHLENSHNLVNVSSELKINGIPESTMESIDNIALKLFDTLSLSFLKTDILNIRRIYPRSLVNSKSTSSNCLRKNTSSFFAVILFKSKEIRQHVLNTKRKYGTLRFSDIVKGSNSNIITIHEMHCASCLSSALCC